MSGKSLMGGCSGKSGHPKYGSGLSFNKDCGSWIQLASEANRQSLNSYIRGNNSYSVAVFNQEEFRMVDDFEGKEVRSSGELWSEICSSLPELQPETSPDNNTEFKDSFQPAAPVGLQVNGQSNGTNTSSSSAKWEPMEDSEIYIASLENRLKKLKGQSSDVTSRDMLRSLSQAKKECWDRFLHDAQTSELFQGTDMDESALEHFKRWLIPEKVAISAEELEYLLRPTQNKEAAEPNQTQNDAEGTDVETHNTEEDDTHTPEK